MEGNGRAGGPTGLLDELLPRYDASIVRESLVEAPPELTYAAVSETNLLDPVIRGAFALRELPGRLLGRMRGESVPEVARSLTLKELARPEFGMAVLAERPGEEIVVGSVGRFWEKDYGHRDVGADEFASFDEPGYARLAMAFRVRPAERGNSRLRYEARTATTDAVARRRFRWYWWLIRWGVWLVMGRALALIRHEAEARVRQEESRS